MKKNSRIGKFVAAFIIALVIFGVGGEASAASFELTQEQKEAYHKQYVQIVKEVIDDHPGVSMKVSPLNEFEPESWVEPGEFRKLAIERANMTFVDETAESGITPYAVKATKSKSFTSNNKTASLRATGSFNTEYVAGLNRQVFTGLNSLTSTTTDGTWRQTGYTPRVIDGSITYAITVSGIYTYNSLSSSHHVFYEFYLSKAGGIS